LVFFLVLTAIFIETDTPHGGVVGGMSVVLARCIFLVLQLRYEYRPWVYVVNDIGVGILSSPVSALPRYYLLWKGDSLSTMELSHWKSLPAILLITQRNKKLTIVYSKEFHTYILDNVIPKLSNYVERENKWS
jgi:hypothetical protein